MPQNALHCLLALVLMGVPSRGQDVARSADKQEKQKSDEFLFEVQPRVLAAGEAAVLRWSIEGATTVVIRGNVNAYSHWQGNAVVPRDFQQRGTAPSGPARPDLYAKKTVRSTRAARTAGISKITLGNGSKRLRIPALTSSATRAPWVNRGKGSSVCPVSCARNPSARRHGST